MRAITIALHDAGLEPRDIGYINAHGTATQVGDVVETQAIHTPFGEAATGVPVRSTEALRAYLMGATGVVAFIATLLAMADGLILLTANLFETDPECDLGYVPNTARSGVALRAVMSNPFAFGGNNAVLVAKRFS